MPLRSSDESAGERDAVGARARLDGRVQQAVALDDGRARDRTISGNVIPRDAANFFNVSGGS